MALQGFNQLKTSIGDWENIGDNFSSIWNKSGSGMNTLVSHALQEVKPRNWNKNPGYVFKIIGGATSSSAPSDDKEQVVKKVDLEYRLQLNPQEIKQSEPFSIRIIPTQAGVVTENEGFVFKDLVISGTTGIFPSRGTQGVTDSGVARIGGGKSGYQELMEFRNFIREYAEMKTLADGANARLIFQNFKDNEFWLVEPVKFDTNRSKDSPFTYNYNIILKIVGKHELTKAEMELEWYEKIFNTIDQIEDTIDAAINILDSAISTLEQIEQAVDSVLLKPLRQANKMIQSLQSGKNKVSSLPRKFYGDLKYQVNRIRDNFCDFIGQGSTAYDAIYGRGSTLESGVTSTVLTPKQRQILKAFSDCESAMNDMLSSDKYFGDVVQVILNNDLVDADSIISEKDLLDKQVASKKNVLAAFNNEIELPTPNSAFKTIVNSGDILERIAMRFLRDPTRWIEIASLNKLRPPYIDDTLDQEGVLNPGDQILIPSVQSSNLGDSILFKGRETSVTKRLSDQEKFMSVDLLLNSNADIVLNNRGDVELVAGYDNLKQATLLQIGYERGSLYYHPNKGVNIKVGEKNLLMIDEMIQSIRETLESDVRIFKVPNVSLKRQDNLVRLDMTVVANKAKESVPLVLTF